MAVLDGPYYRTNKFLLTILGQWPYQNPLHKRIIRITVLLLHVSFVIPEAYQFVEICDDINSLIEFGSIIGVEVTTGLKFMNYVMNGDKIAMLTDRIQHDLDFYVGSELKMIKKYSNQGRKLTKFYTIYMYTTLVIFFVPPMVPKVLDIVAPLNETRKLVFPLPTKYGELDERALFWPIMFHNFIYGAFVMTTIVAMDATYTMFGQHACGLFAAVGYKLDHLMDEDLNEDADELEIARHEEVQHQKAVSCVKMHNKAIAYAEMLESSHCVLYFFVIGLIVVCMSMSGYQMVMNPDNPEEAFRFAAFTIAQVTHIFFLSWPGQKLIDHSEEIYGWTYQAKWYKGSQRTKKLLLLMMTRSREPCRLTAGKLYIMSFENFSLIIRTSVSYFTVLTSFS